MTTLRVATFNCENLFSRPKVFGEPKEKSQKLLTLYKNLQAELQKHVFDQEKIKALKEDLSGYAKVVDVRGKHYKATGAHDWLGWAELTRDKVSDVAVENTARVIRDTDADVIALMEVEDRLQLQRFHDDVLFPFLDGAGKDPYKHVLLVDGNDDRGIDVALMSRHPVEWMQSHMHETSTYMDRTVKTFSRDCMVFRIDVEGAPLTVMVNHFKSKLSSEKKDPQSNLRRQGQAERVAELLGEYDLQRDYVVVAGDLNDFPGSTSVAPLLDLDGLYNVNMELPEGERWTYHSGKKQIDYVLVSEALRGVLKSVSIERRGIFKKKDMRYDTVVDRRTEASDHAAVIAEFAV